MADDLTLLLPRASDFLWSPYGYIPTEYVCIMFIVLFGISTFAHTVEAIFLRTWWLLPTACLAGALEVLGWAGRLWSSDNITGVQPFQIQITATILAPTPLVAANFIILGRTIARLGPTYSRLSPKWYTIVFLSCDIIALIVQGIGGGMASSAAGSGRDPSLGGRVMLGGIAFQLVTIAVYAVCALEFYLRYLSIYRTIELADGWGGRKFTTEVYFNVLDGAMIVLAMCTLNVANPGLLLSEAKLEDAPSVEERKRPASSSRP
ncbi:RTA1-domain-containing protein [Pleurotus eryngii]|uniref:RTA1-domain-containing protein n=1 Tax=Pleurotus eryngii TaxID=5323 RepID=A0A9P5ZXF7_PLEER|nr:RTA1-domain-containing protein [Pleurotus eryngii]